MFATIHNLFAAIITYLHQNPRMGSFLAFLISFTESLPILGTIFPGSVTMTAMGALIGAGVLPADSTILWAIIGAFTGDVVGYSVGYIFQDSIQKMWPFRRYPQWLEKGEKFFQSHGGKSIIFGRFIGPARSAVPMIAGLLRMNCLRFLLAAVPSAMMWAILYITPGIILGALSLEIPPAKTTEFVLVGLGLIIVIWFIFWAVQFFFRQVVGFINRKIDHLWSWLSHHHGSEWFIKLITNQENPKDHHQLTLSLLSFICFLLFLTVFFQVSLQGPLTQLNQPIFHVLQSFRGPHLDNLFIVITNLGLPKLMLCTSMVLVFLLALCKQWRPSLHLFFMIALVTCIAWLFKDLLYFSPRPTGFLSVKAESSFPSGHVALSTATFSFVAYLIVQRAGEASRAVTYALTTTLLILIAFSRLYLGTHWFTDVLASAFLGCFILFATLVSYRRHRLNIKLKSLSGWKFAGILVLAFLPISLLVGYKYFPKVKHNTTPYFLVQSVPTETWWSDPTHYLPHYRNNRFGEARQPFNLQWLGDIQHIQNYLSQQGWIFNPEKITLKTAINRFASKDPQYHLPALPALYQHHKPQLTMIKYLPNHEGIYVLRLWHSAIVLSDSKKTLWIGSIYLQYPPPKLLSFHFMALPSFLVKSNVTQLLGNLKQRQSKIIVIPAESQPPRIRELNWNGEILIIRD